MATLQVTELKNVKFVSGSALPIAVLPSVAEQTVAISGTSAASSAFNTATRFIRVSTDTACHILVSSGTPTATTSKTMLAAGAVEYFAVTAGHSIAVIAH